MMPNALCLGPDGWLYFPLVPLGEVWRVGTAGGPAERVAGGFDVPTAVKFNAAGHLHVNESGNGAVTRVDLSSGTRETAAQVAFGTDNLAFAPDGRMFVSHYTNGEVTEFSRDGSSRIVAKGHDRPVRALRGTRRRTRRRRRHEPRLDRRGRSDRTSRDAATARLSGLCPRSGDRRRGRNRHE